MAASSRSGVSRKLWILASAVILAIALYTAGWFYAASVLKQNTLALLGSQQKRGITATSRNWRTVTRLLELAGER